MQQSKAIKNIHEVANYSSDSNIIFKTFENIIRQFKLLGVNKILNQAKSKGIEKIGKVFDHFSHKYILGLKVLVCGFWDGKSFNPLDFTVHNEPGKKKNRGMKAKELNQ
jgi:hypothetical protein